MSYRKALFDRYRTMRVFLRTGAGAGVLLFAAALVAVVCANSSLAAAYEHFLHLPIGISVADYEVQETLSHWINDGLMAIFFLLVGLEIKREMLTGELSSLRLALLPTFAALGGMIVPALIFTGFNHADPMAMRGWAVPLATDIAFSLGLLAMLGSRVPLQAKVFLTAVAVIDDLGAIAIIAIFYSADVKLGLLGLCVLVLLVMFLINWAGVVSRFPYLLLGGVLWMIMLESGLHATLAGVLTAMTIPHGTNKAKTSTTLMRLEHSLHNPVTYLILPLFAFANAGVSLVGIEFDTLLLNSLPLGITMGLLFGKPIGICSAVYLAVRTGVCRLPRNTDGMMVVGVSLLCGIGFTVSLFIADLGFGRGEETDLANLAKAGVLTGSLLAGVGGYLVMHRLISTRAIDRA